MNNCNILQQHFSMLVFFNVQNLQGIRWGPMTEKYCAHIDDLCFRKTLITFVMHYNINNNFSFDLHLRKGPNFCSAMPQVPECATFFKFPYILA